MINNRWYTTERDYDKYIADTFSKSILGIDINKAKAVMDLLEKEEMLMNQLEVSPSNRKCVAACLKKKDKEYYDCLPEGSKSKKNYKNYFFDFLYDIKQCFI